MGVHVPVTALIDMMMMIVIEEYAPTDEVLGASRNQGTKRDRGNNHFSKRGWHFSLTESAIKAGNLHSDDER